MASESHHMFPMGLTPDHHLSVHHNPYASWPAPQPQQISARPYLSTSSAFSASAHPDEDWTKVSDLAERRRIQNRIAQRNYRKKIKQRMEDLERRAGDGSKPAASSKKPSKSSNSKKQHQRRQSSPPVNNGASLQAPQAHNPMFTPPMTDDQPFFPSPSPPASSPPTFAYQPAFSPPSENGYYGAGPVTTWMTTAATTATAAPTLPPMTHFSEAYKQAAPGGNESMSSFPSYGDYSLGVPPTASPYDSNPHVSSHHHHHHHHHQSHQRATAHNSTLLPPVSTFPSYGGSSYSTSSSSSSLAGTAPTGHLAAPDPYRPRYAPLPPSRV